MTKIRKPTARQQQAALDIIAGWLGPKMGTKYDAPAPTGEQAWRTGSGPLLDPAWQSMWCSSPPCPTILMEGALEDWSIRVAADPVVRAALRTHGLWVEPWNGYALAIHRITVDY